MNNIDGPYNLCMSKCVILLYQPNSFSMWHIHMIRFDFIISYLALRKFGTTLLGIQWVLSNFQFSNCATSKNENSTTQLSNEIEWNWAHFYSKFKTIVKKLCTFILIRWNENTNCRVDPEKFSSEIFGFIEFMVTEINTMPKFQHDIWWYNFVLIFRGIRCYSTLFFNDKNLRSFR